MMRHRTPDTEAARRRLQKLYQTRPSRSFGDDNGVDDNNPDDTGDSSVLVRASSSTSAVEVVVLPHGEQLYNQDDDDRSFYGINNDNSGKSYCDDEEDDVDALPQTSYNYHASSISTPPPSYVPAPQILSDSKKTSSPRRYRYLGIGPSIHRRIFEITLIFHLFSLFACVASSHFASSRRSQPCKNLRFPPSSPRHNSTAEKCIFWSNSSIPDICSAGTQSRIRILNHTFLFPELHPLSLYELFATGYKDGGSWELQSGEKGQDCITGSINRCTSCFRQLSGTLRRLDEAFRSFDVTLSRFDCLPAVDTASATRPFSPNATCENCKIWYRRWLLVQTLQIWKRPPCINWCYYTQLACPHLAPAKLWDYAGHPSFQCRDMDIDSWRQECECVHPCDVRGVVSTAVIGKAPSFRHDFFAAQVHCETRKRECHNARSTNHDRRTIISTAAESAKTTTTTTTVLTTTTLATSGGGRLLEWTTPRLYHYILLLLLWML